MRSPPSACIRTTAGQPPAGGFRLGSKSVAASGTPSSALIVTSCRVTSDAGEALPARTSRKRVATAAIRPVRRTVTKPSQV